MDEYAMMHPDTWPILLLLPVCFIGGAVLGAVYFRSLQLTADLIVKGHKPALVIALAFARLIVLAAGFAIAIPTGGIGILGTLAGVIAGRELIIRRKWGVRA
ncbi:ATP synthase subunit I [Thalassospira alkalitolerans]|uniref:N-ATPase subunit AtpR n=1 Tax=Thalassospira alkalitolerans TaxID=1293890 RepID=UPI003AA8B3FE